MKIVFLCISLFYFLLLSCSEKKQSDLLEIPIDINQNSGIPLSEIAEEITAIELELTDASMFNPDHVQGISISGNKVFIVTLYKILVFNKAGKYICAIGSRGQGPGEYVGIRNIAVDEKSKRLFINTGRKIITYDFNGFFLNETVSSVGLISTMNYINEKLLFIADEMDYDSDSKQVYSRAILYQLNDNLQLIDSCTIRNLYVESSSGTPIYWGDDFLLKGSKSVYLYYGDFFWRKNLEEKVLRDTLYQFEKNHLIPDLKLKFKNEGKFIHLYNIYRSSRYIFAVYNYENHTCFFCYDTKTGKGYNIKTQDGNGYIDDINQIEKRIRVRPFSLDTEMFYYLHTHIDPDDLEEPNPTLYIGTFKK